MSTITENFLSVETEEVVDVEPALPLLRHIVNPPNNLHIFEPHMTAQDIVDIARVRKIEVVALCGVLFIPRRNVENLETCDECLHIAGMILSSSGK